MTSYADRALDSFFAVVVDNNNRSVVMYFDNMNDSASMYAGYNMSDPSGGNYTRWLFGPATDRVVLPLLVSVIGVIAMTGNLFFIYNVTSYKRMRTGPNLMLVNIACADLVFVACVVPLSAVNQAAAGSTLLQDAWLVQTCKFVHYVMFVTIYVIVYTLVVTCVFVYCGERVRCTTTAAMLSRTTVVISCFVIWASFICSHLTLLVPADGAIFQEAFICVHTEDLPSGGDPANVRTLWLTFLACAFLFPTLAICILSALVLRRQQLRYEEHRDPTCDDDKLSEVQRKRELLMVVMVSMIVRAVCWLPMQLFVLLYLFAEAGTLAPVYQLADLVGVMSVFIGACLNPFLYNCLSSELRQAFGETYRKSICSCSEEKQDGEYSDMNETIMSIISDSSNRINYLHVN